MQCFKVLYGGWQVLVDKTSCRTNLTNLSIFKATAIQTLKVDPLTILNFAVLYDLFIFVYTVIH